MKNISNLIESADSQVLLLDDSAMDVTFGGNPNGAHLMVEYIGPTRSLTISFWAGGVIGLAIVGGVIIAITVIAVTYNDEIAERIAGTGGSGVVQIHETSRPNVVGSTNFNAGGGGHEGGPANDN